MPKRPKNHRQSVTAADVRRIRQLVKAGTPAPRIAAELGRTVTATRQIASVNGISLRVGAGTRPRKKK